MRELCFPLAEIVVLAREMEREGRRKTGNRQLVEFLARLRAVNFQSVQTKYQRQARSKPSQLFFFAPTLQRMLSVCELCVCVCVCELCVLSFVDDGFDIVQGCSYY